MWIYSASTLAGYCSDQTELSRQLRTHRNSECCRIKTFQGQRNGTRFQASIGFVYGPFNVRRLFTLFRKTADFPVIASLIDYTLAVIFLAHFAPLIENKNNGMVEHPVWLMECFMGFTVNDFLENFHRFKIMIAFWRKLQKEFSQTTVMFYGLLHRIKKEIYHWNLHYHTQLFWYLLITIERRSSWCNMQCKCVDGYHV